MVEENNWEDISNNCSDKRATLRTNTRYRRQNTEAVEETPEISPTAASNFICIIW
ncbi:MAG TPA: hypothetical protein VFI70_13460 [Nitrososphaeraceae archaeon]|nr:hypothetical protein [Nitrososphaeraceae archaeon]